MGVDVAESGGGAGLVDEAGDHVPVDALAVLSGQQQSVAVGDVGRAVVGDEFDQPRMQGQVAVLVELPDRDVEPVRVSDQDDGVGGREEPGRGLVVERFGECVVLLRDVAGEHRHPGRGVVPTPFIDA